MAEDLELRGRFAMLNEAFAVLVNRVDQIVAASAQARRFTLTTTLTAGLLVLTALGLIGGLVFAILA